MLDRRNPFLEKNVPKTSPVHKFIFPARSNVCEVGVVRN
jgi:hypothetical protein